MPTTKTRHWWLRVAYGCKPSSKAILPCWPALKAQPIRSARRPSASPIPSAAIRCSRRWPRPARGQPPTDPALADLVRKEQDLTKQVNAQLGALNNVLAIPSSERDAKGVQQIQSAITTQRAERDKARLEIKQKFPAYAELVSPKPPNVSEIERRLPTAKRCCHSISDRIAPSSGPFRSRGRSLLRR